jgi:hypothetical protein
LLADIGAIFNFFFRSPSFDKVERKRDNKDMGSTKEKPN